MKVIYGVGNLKKQFKNAVLAIGVFDGLHLGHQKLIRAAVRRAKALGTNAVVMTFSPHPVQVLKPDRYLPFIISLPHRLRIIEGMGVVACVVVRFTKRFSQLTPQEFIKRYLADRIHPKEIFVGEDFRFGQGRSGTIDYFKRTGAQYGFRVNTIAPVRGGDSKIGSSRIRDLINDGKLTAAKRFLGRNVSLLGTVVRGDRRGKRLGFPTANLQLENTVLPPVGVYAVYVMIGAKKYKGMANIGRRPSFRSSNKKINVEVHIFNFRKNLYGREILVEFIKRIRDENTFPSKEAFSRQLKQDAVKARQMLSSH